MKKTILENVANSLPVRYLLRNEHFTKTLGSLLNLRNTAENFIEDKILGTLKIFEVPSRKEIQAMEKKIHQLENELMSMHRRALIKKLKTTTPKTNTKKKVPKKK